MAQGLKWLGVALLLAGCGQAMTDAVPDPDGKVPGVGNAAYNGQLLASDLLIREETPELDFSATMAAEMALAPGLAQAIRSEALAHRKKMQADATTAMNVAKDNDFPARPYAVIQRWRAEAETPALLAFSGLLWEDTGGAHGNSGFAVTLYDRANDRRMTTNDLFTDPEAALAALQQPWCAALAIARRAKRSSSEPTPFDDCPALSELPIVPTGQGTITALKVLAAPYVAGPYAEGSYEVVIGSDPVLSFLKPEWRATFGAVDVPAP